MSQDIDPDGNSRVTINWRPRQFQWRDHITQLARLSGANEDDNKNHDDSAQDVRAATILGPKKEASSDHNDEQAKNDDGITRRAVIEGREVIFQLSQNITSNDGTKRTDRCQNNRTITVINSSRSRWEVRMRNAMIELGLAEVCVAYLSLFILMNTVFAALFYAHPDGCCDDPDMTFAEMFDFSVQTSSTIGYGGYVPSGKYSNFLVVVLTYTSIVLNTVLAGLLFMKFTSPVAKLQFSACMVYCNVKGLPCLQVRVGNCDGHSNLLTDVSAKLEFLFDGNIRDKYSADHHFIGTEELPLFNGHVQQLVGTWTMLHVVDETSPLFALPLDDSFPASCITCLQLTVTAVHHPTKSPITCHKEYALQDILIGHTFADSQLDKSNNNHSAQVDFSRMDDTKEAPVWYPMSQI